ncbi:MAG: nucleotidyl transferase AbiEii/AbiGii toxin family protein [Dermatophilaceae bacterium]
MSSGTTRGVEVFDVIRRRARGEAARTGTPAATGEYLVRHALESFLHRLSLTRHRDDFVLKGGILLAAYGIRRPTRDIDAEAVSANVTPPHLEEVVVDIANLDVDDGVVLDPTSTAVAEIRDDAEYPGLRLKVTSHIGRQQVVVSWDVSTGDPIVPPARVIQVPRVLGPDFEIRGYAPATVIAEKGVTTLECGTSSTRWCDYVDIVELDRRYDVSRAALEASVRAVAAHRGVDVRPITPIISGYGVVGQRKWAAWRRKTGVQALSEELLDDQMTLVARVLDDPFAAIQSAGG